MHAMEACALQCLAAPALPIYPLKTRTEDVAFAAFHFMDVEKLSA